MTLTSRHFLPIEQTRLHFFIGSINLGIAGSLFFNANNSDAQTLHRRCTPSDEQFDEQLARWHALAEHLGADLRARSGYAINTWLQGSYKFGTQIRPILRTEEFDIDLGVYYRWDGEPDAGEHGVGTLKNFVQASLEAYAVDNEAEVEEISPPKTRCCRIRFKRSFHIDVPAYHLDPNRDQRTLATNQGWESSDPKAIYLWFRDSFDNATRFKVRRQIRYLKTWAALKFGRGEWRPSSIMLTVLVADAVLELNSDQIKADDELLALILDRIVARLARSRAVPNPVAPGDEDLNRLSEGECAAFISQLGAFQVIAARANLAETESDASYLWQEVFEHLFPMPEATPRIAEGARAVVARTVIPEIRVTGISRTNRNAPAFVGVNAITVPKECDLTFEVINLGALPVGSVIIWIVRNEGREAELANDLGHLGQTGTVATENSQYTGRHYMDCLVKVAGRVVAMRRVPVTITGTVVPPRNPVRPPWRNNLLARR